MKYVWSRHATSERLPERSGLTVEEVEQRLDRRVYVVPCRGRSEEHHLIWDEVKGCLVDIPVVLGTESGIIPTVRPVDYGSGYTEWQRAEAERAWRGEEYYREPENTAAEALCSAEAVLARLWTKPSGWPESRDIAPVLSWRVFDPVIARTGDEGVITLLKDREFCRTIAARLLQWKKHASQFMPGDKPVVHLKKPGAHRLIPLEFFLSAP